MSSPWYVPRPAAADVRGSVACVWTAEPRGEHRLVPDGCVDVVWLDRGGAWLCGTETRGWTFRLPPGVHAVGVRFRPAVAAAVFGFDGSEVVERRVTLDAVLPGPAVRRLDERLLAAGPDGGRRLVELQHEVRTWLARAPRPVDPVAAAAAHGVARPEGRPTVDRLALELGLSARQLHRRCVRSFGYGPTTLTRILRLQRFLAVAPRWGSLAAGAAAAGYADQAHLARDCRAIAGVTPGQLVRSVQDSGPGQGASSTT